MASNERIIQSGRHFSLSSIPEKKSYLLTRRCFSQDSMAVSEGTIVRQGAGTNRTHTQPRTQAADSLLCSRSSERYRTITLAPSEKPRPSSGERGYLWAMYTSACLMSSVYPAEYSWGDVMGTPAPGKQDLLQLQNKAIT